MRHPLLRLCLGPLVFSPFSIRRPLLTPKDIERARFELTGWLIGVYFVIYVVATIVFWLERGEILMAHETLQQQLFSPLATSVMQFIGSALAFCTALAIMRRRFASLNQRQLALVDDWCRREPLLASYRTLIHAHRALVNGDFQAMRRYVQSHAAQTTI